MKRPLALIGCGNAATALAVLLARHGRPVNLYCIEPDVMDDVNRRHRNAKYLKGVPLARNIRAFGSVAQAVHKADVVLVAVPSFAVREAVALAAPFLAPDAVIGSIAKGLDPETLQPIALTAARLLPANLKKRLVVIGGPAVATELATRKPGAVLLAGPDRSAVSKLAKLLESDTIKVAISEDLKGVGYAMALKNSYAIALGMCDGLHYPMNTKALVLSLAVQEMGRILAASGARPETAASLAGLGDLLVTGLSPHGRNRTYGERLVGSRTKDPKRLGLLTVEGISATALGMRLIRRLKIRAPLMETIADCLRRRNNFERPFVTYLKKLRLT